MSAEATLVDRPVAAIMTPSVDVAVRLAPSRASAVAAARSAAAILSEHPGVPVRVVGLEPAGPRVHITLAIGLGDVADVAKCRTAGKAGLEAIKAIVDALTAYDVALVSMPHPESSEAIAAGALLQRDEPSLDQLVLALV